MSMEISRFIYPAVEESVYDFVWLVLRLSHTCTCIELVLWCLPKQTVHPALRLFTTGVCDCCNETASTQPLCICFPSISVLSQCSNFRNKGRTLNSEGVASTGALLTHLKPVEWSLQWSRWWDCQCILWCIQNPCQIVTDVCSGI